MKVNSYLQRAFPFYKIGKYIHMCVKEDSRLEYDIKKTRWTPTSLITFHEIR